MGNRIAKLELVALGSTCLPQFKAHCDDIHSPLRSFFNKLNKGAVSGVRTGMSKKIHHSLAEYLVSREYFWFG